MRLTFVLFCFLIASCSTGYYQPDESKDIAHVSFSNLSPEIPGILITIGCKQSKLDPKFVKFRKPNDRAWLSISVPSNQPVTFTYRYAWFEGEMTQLISKGGQFSSRIEEKTVKDVKSCDENFTFIPKTSHKYEVYFGKNANSCLIKASEVFFEPDTQKKYLIKVEQVMAPKC